MSNTHLADNSIVEDIYDSLSICQRTRKGGHPSAGIEIIVPAVGEVVFDPTKSVRILFLGTSIGAFRMFVDSFSEIHLDARPIFSGPLFVYTVTVSGRGG